MMKGKNVKQVNLKITTFARMREVRENRRPFDNSIACHTVKSNQLNAIKLMSLQDEE